MNLLIITAVILTTHFNVFSCFTPETILSLDFDNNRPFTELGDPVGLHKFYRTNNIDVYLTDYTSISRPTSNNLNCKLPFSFKGQKSNRFCVNSPDPSNPNEPLFRCETTSGQFGDCQTGYFIFLNNREFSSRIFFNNKMTLSKDFDYSLKFSYIIDDCNDDVNFSFGLTRFTTSETREILNSTNFPYQVIKKWNQHESIFRVGVDSSFLIQLNATNKGCSGYIAIDELKLIKIERNENIVVSEIVFESDSMSTENNLIESTSYQENSYASDNTSENIILTESNDFTETSNSNDAFSSTNNLRETTASYDYTTSTKLDDLTETSDSYDFVTISDEISDRSTNIIEESTQSNSAEKSTIESGEIFSTSSSSELNENSTNQQLDEDISTEESIIINSKKSLEGFEIGLIVAGCGLAVIGVGSFLFWQFKIKPQKQVLADQNIRIEPNQVDEHSV